MIPLRWIHPAGVALAGHIPEQRIRLTPEAARWPGLPAPLAEALAADGGWLSGGEAEDLVVGELMPLADGAWLGRTQTAIPDTLLRLDARTGPQVADDDRTWVVPRLLNPDGTLAVERSLHWRSGAWTWDPPAGLERILLALRDWLRSPVEAWASDAARLEQARLAADCLALNYHLHLAELSALGWMGERLPPRLIAAACGFDWDLVHGATPAGGNHG
jgi:hypothetical protein